MQCLLKKSSVIIKYAFILGIFTLRFPLVYNCTISGQMLLLQHQPGWMLLTSTSSPVSSASSVLSSSMLSSCRCLLSGTQKQRPSIKLWSINKKTYIYVIIYIISDHKKLSLFNQNQSNLLIQVFLYMYSNMQRSTQCRQFWKYAYLLSLLELLNYYLTLAMSTE